MGSVVFFVTVISSLISSIVGCGSPSSCRWTDCNRGWTNWTPWYTPDVGSCMHTSRVYWASPVVREQRGNCPGNQVCYNQHFNMAVCRCNVDSVCGYGSWGSWSQEVPSRGQCVQQRRLMPPMVYTQVVTGDRPCDSYPRLQCTNSKVETRTTCSCVYASSCQFSSWSTWSDSVQDGQCGRDSRMQASSPVMSEVQMESCNSVISVTCNNIVEYRRKCRCPKADCVNGDWAAWTLMDINEHCPKLTRKRLIVWKQEEILGGAYDSCSHYNMPTTCPGDSNAESQDIYCPTLHATWPMSVNPRCSSFKLPCGSICPFSCADGYKINRLSLVCSKYGNWSAPNPDCTDVTPPTITCPSDISQNTELGLNYSILKYANPTVEDNSRETLTAQCAIPSQSKLPIGFTVNRCQATDSSGRTSICTFSIHIQDKEPPIVLYCPESIVVHSTSPTSAAFWQSPRFKDNVDAVPIVTATHMPGSSFNYVDSPHRVTYIARDTAGNTATCSFSVSVSYAGCQLFEPPKNGARICNIQFNGVENRLVCTTQCQKGYAPAGTGYSSYYCTMEGIWTAFEEDMSSVVLEPGVRPWPDCTESSETGTSYEYEFYVGSCLNADQATLEKLKISFLNVVKGNFLVKEELCAISSECEVTNVEVTCGSSSSKRELPDFKDKIKIVVRIRVLPKVKRPSSTPGGILLRGPSQSSTLVDKLIEKLSLISGVSRSSITMQGYTTEETCAPGSAISKVNETTICTKCPSGTYNPMESDSCLTCAPGYFQESEGAIECKPCPAGKSTVGIGPDNFKSCQELCKPGTYSKTGLATCTACPVGTFQPSANSTSCFNCPQGLTTQKAASIAIDACVRGPV